MGAPQLETIAASVRSGCRWEEVAGLRRANLDLKNDELRVRTVAARISAGRYELKDVPMNDYSRRDIELPGRLVEILQFHLASAPDSDLAFPNERGGIIDYGNFRERVFAPAVARSGLEPFTFHDLRHTHVAWLVDADWSEYRIVRRMGWKDSRMLYTTYGHLLDKHNREGMATLEERWIEPTPPQHEQALD
jgi:integrase